MRKVRLSSIFIARIKGESDLYVALPVTSYSSGCNPLRSPCVAAPCNPHCRSYARRRMQRKHFKGPRAVDRVSRACHRLSNSLNISGIDHPRKFLLPLRGSARSPPRVYATEYRSFYDEHDFPIALLSSDYPLRYFQEYLYLPVTIIDVLVYRLLRVGS